MSSLATSSLTLRRPDVAVAVLPQQTLPVVHEDAPGQTKPCTRVHDDSTREASHLAAGTAPCEAFMNAACGAAQVVIGDLSHGTVRIERKIRGTLCLGAAVPSFSVDI